MNTLACGLIALIEHRAETWDLSAEARDIRASLLREMEAHLERAAAVPWRRPAK